MTFESYKGRLLCMAVRIVMEEARAGHTPKISFETMVGLACRRAGIPEDRWPDTALVNQLMNRPMHILPDDAEQALKAVIARYWDEVADKLGGTEWIDREAQRRVAEKDYPGARALPKDWVAAATPPMPALPVPRSSVEQTIEILSSWAKVVGIPAHGGSQSFLKDIAGDYLIVRYLFTADRFVVSHMAIHPPVSSDLPTWFQTKGGEGLEQHDFGQVEGIAFVPDSGPNRIMSIGRVRGVVNLRSALLEAVPKPGRLVSELDAAAPKNRDLWGLRVSLGTALATPVAHRLWCSKVRRADNDLLGKYGTYSPEAFRDIFGHGIDGFDTIARWVCAVPTISRDPVTPRRDGIGQPDFPF